MLMTLLLQYFPGMCLSFVSEAICWTIGPHALLWILLLQCHYWINSTTSTMCGLCCLSMTMVVIMDLIVTMTLPALLICISSYLIYLMITQPDLLGLFILIIYGTTLLCNTNVELYCMSVMGLHLVVLHFYHWWYPCLILLVTLCMPLPTWMTSCGVSCINWVRQKPQKKPKQKQLILATPVMNQSNKKQMIMLPIDLKTQVIQFTGWWTTHLQ